MSSLPEIRKSVSNTDEILNLLIQDFIINSSFYFGNRSISVSEWRIVNYEELRKNAYPKACDYLDAIGKINNPGKKIKDKEDGEVELRAYYQKRQNVKDRFPKE